MKKKLLSLITASVVTAAMLAGCGKTASETVEEAAREVEEAAEETVEEAPKSYSKKNKKNRNK